MRIFLTSLILLLVAPVAWAGERIALVIGIDNYVNVTSLQKAANDAHAVSATLEGLGFRVTKLIDADRRTFNRELSLVASAIQPGDEVVFYFAGHGIEVAGRNYLLPADVPGAAPGEEQFLIGESIGADRVLKTFQDRGARVSLLILDACRNNPFPTVGTRSLGGSRGLARMDPPEGAFILFSAGTGQTALDRLSNSDPDPNSVFTRALLPRLRQPGMSIHDLVQEVRSDVRQLAASVQHDQFPAYYDQLSGVFTFSPGVAAPDTTTTLPAIVSTPENGAATPPAVIDPCDAARADWQVLSTARSLSALQTFTRVHAACPVFVALAQDRLSTLANSVQPNTVTPPAQQPDVGADTCSQLWYARNLIFHQRGYCFSTSRAQAVFDNSQCTTRSPSLSAAEKAEVSRIQAAERANGC